MDFNLNFWISTRAFKLSSRNSQLVTCNSCFTISRAKSVQIRSYFWSIYRIFGLNTEIYSVISIFSPNTGNCRPEITPYLDTFCAVSFSIAFVADFEDVTVCWDESVTWKCNVMFIRISQALLFLSLYLTKFCLLPLPFLVSRITRLRFKFVCVRDWIKGVWQRYWILCFLFFYSPCSLGVLMFAV